MSKYCWNCKWLVTNYLNKGDWDAMCVNLDVSWIDNKIVFDGEGWKTPNWCPLPHVGEMENNDE